MRIKSFRRGRWARCEFLDHSSIKKVWERNAMSKQKVRWASWESRKSMNGGFPSFLRTPHAVLAGIASRDGTRPPPRSRQAMGYPQVIFSYGPSSLPRKSIWFTIPSRIISTIITPGGRRPWQGDPLRKTALPDGHQAQALVDHCEKKKALLMDGFMWPHHPRTNHLREIIPPAGSAR